MRPKDPRGRDRTRTIQLSGDVADIAERLSQEGRLSKEISRLLFEEYGHSSQVKKLEAEMAILADQMQQIDIQRAKLENRLELAKNSQKVASKHKEEISIKLESMIESLRMTEAMIQCGNTHNQHGQSYTKIKKNQSELVEKYRRQLEAFE